MALLTVSLNGNVVAQEIGRASRLPSDAILREISDAVETAIMLERATVTIEIGPTE